MVKVVGMGVEGGGVDVDVIVQSTLGFEGSRHGDDVITILIL
jgi:hypothetical protein